MVCWSFYLQTYCRLQWAYVLNRAIIWSDIEGVHFDTIGVPAYTSSDGGVQLMTPAEIGHLYHTSGTDVQAETTVLAVSKPTMNVTSLGHRGDTYLWMNHTIDFGLRLDSTARLLGDTTQYYVPFNLHIFAEYVDETAPPKLKFHFDAGVTAFKMMFQYAVQSRMRDYPYQWVVHGLLTVAHIPLLKLVKGYVTFDLHYTSNPYTWNHEFALHMNIFGVHAMAGLMVTSQGPQVAVGSGGDGENDDAQAIGWEML